MEMRVNQAREKDLVFEPTVDPVLIAVQPGTHLVEIPDFEDSLAARGYRRSRGTPRVHGVNAAGQIDDYFFHFCQFPRVCRSIRYRSYPTLPR